MIILYQQVEAMHQAVGVCIPEDDPARSPVEIRALYAVVVGLQPIDGIGVTVNGDGIRPSKVPVHHGGHDGAVHASPHDGRLGTPVCPEHHSNHNQHIRHPVE